MSPLADLQEQQAEQEREEHVQLAEMEGEIVGNLRDHREETKAQGIALHRVRVMKAFHEKITHGDGSEIADVGEHFVPDTIKDQRVCDVVAGHRGDGEVFDLLAVQEEMPYRARAPACIFGCIRVSSLN